MKKIGVLAVCILLSLVSVAFAERPRNSFWFLRAPFVLKANQELAKIGSQGSELWFQEVYQVQYASPIRPMYRDASRLILLSDKVLSFGGVETYRLGYFFDYDGNANVVGIDVNTRDFQFIEPSFNGRLAAGVELKQVEALKIQIIKELPEVTVDWAPGDKMFGVGSSNFSAIVQAYEIVKRNHSLFRLLGVSKSYTKADDAPLFGDAVLVSSNAEEIDLKNYYSDLSKSIVVMPLSWPPLHQECESFLKAK